MLERQGLRTEGAGAAPEGVGEREYDETAASMIGLLRHGSGVQWYRLEGLEASLGIPMPASTQWEVVAVTAEWIRPGFEKLVRQAPQAEVFYNDDKSMKILALLRGSPHRLDGKEEMSSSHERSPKAHDRLQEAVPRIVGGKRRFASFYAASCRTRTRFWFMAAFSIHKS